VVLNGIVSFIVLLLLALGVYDNEITATVLLTLASLNTAFIDVVVDALMVT